MFMCNMFKIVFYDIIPSIINTRTNTNIFISVEQKLCKNYIVLIIYNHNSSV